MRGLALVLLALSGAAAARAGQLITREEALTLAYPGASIAAERVFLTGDQQKRAGEMAGQAVPSALVGRYVATKDGTVVGRAYVDTHTVRTKKETILVSLDANGQVRRVDVTAFAEPPEYQAPPAFPQQFRGKRLDGDLQVQRAIRPIAGATLTARTMTEAVRRVLAIDAVLAGRGGTGK